jgi:hypothetical protein
MDYSTSGLSEEMGRSLARHHIANLGKVYSTVCMSREELVRILGDEKMLKSGSQSRAQTVASKTGVNTVLFGRIRGIKDRIIIETSVYDKELEQTVFESGLEINSGLFMEDQDTVSLVVLESVMAAVKRVDAKKHVLTMEKQASRRPKQKPIRKKHDSREDYYRVATRQNSFSFHFALVENGLPVGLGVAVNFFKPINRFLALRPCLNLSYYYDGNHFFNISAGADLIAIRRFKYVNFFGGGGPEIWYSFGTGGAPAAGIIAGFTPVKTETFEFDLWSKYHKGKDIGEYKVEFIEVGFTYKRF